MAERLVIFGGTFDPVHHGHLIVARAVAERCGFDRITFVLAGSPPHKPPACTSDEHRLAMLRCAIAGEEMFDICGLELGRGGPSYTLDTLEALGRQYGAETEFHWVIGADMLEDLPSWHGVDEVLQRANLIIAARPPWQQRMEGIFKTVGRKFSPRQMKKLISAVVPTPLIDISSTQIRQRVKAGRSIKYLVPDSVSIYIRKNDIYAPPKPL